MSVRESKYLELDEGAGARIARRLLSHAAEHDFFSFALLSREEWIAVLRAHSPAQSEGYGAIAGAAPDARGGSAIDALRARYALDEQGAMLVVALRYASDVEPESQGTRVVGIGAETARLEPARPPAPACGNPVATVGRFARANWYRELLDRLAECAVATAQDMAAEGLPRMPTTRWHRFANSRFPEKALAMAAGLGTIGRNSLIIAERSPAPLDGGARGARQAPRWSSAVVLGLMFLPFDVQRGACLPRQQPRAMLELCGTCARCVDACPTGALGRTAVSAEPHGSFPTFSRASCIQHYTSIDGALPENIQNAWSDQFYGCDICLESCPHFAPDPAATAKKGRIGGGFDARALAQMDEPALQRAFKASALDQRWISAAALTRNASIIVSAAAAQRDAPRSLYRS